MIKRLPWLRSRKKTDPEVPLRLPIACGPDSARTRLIRKLVNEKAEEVSRREGIDRREFMASACGMATTLYMINLVNGCADQHAADNRLGMSGRDGGAGMNGAAGRKVSGGSGSGSSARHDAGAGMDAGNAAGGSGGSGTGGYTGITDAAMEDPGAAACALGDGGNELIIDMQTHFLTSALPGGIDGALPIPTQITKERYPWLTRTPGCEKERFTCYEQQEYVDQIFMNSDTTISVLSGTPYSLGADGTNAGGFAVLSNEEVLAAAKELEASFPNRVLTQCMVMPNDRIDLQLAMMERNAGKYDNWNTCPPWSPNQDSGYWLDEGVGPQMLQKGIDLNRPIFSIYKGLPFKGFSSTHTNPKDVGPAALMFPNAYFVISHSAFDHGFAAGESSAPSLDDPQADLGWGAGVGQWPEGPYDESLEALGDDQPTDKGAYPLNRGVNSLIKSLRDAGIGPNGMPLDGKTGPLTNVYADCSWAWASLMTGRVEEAMHYWGKLMKHVGEDRLLWGTDCLWFGCPQPLIQTFRAFEISQEFQDKYGYPALTQSRKEKILGWNAARLQNVVTTRIDPIVDCHRTFVGNDFMKRKRDLDTEFGVRRDMIRNVPGPRTRRAFLMLRAAEHREKVALSGRVPARRRV
jgi:predicted TIM-barrel fold metal-dependent hydrolase